jgi:hypothetical protein
MALATVRAAFGLARRLESPCALLSGGEPTDHPELPLIVEWAKRAFPVTVILSNGLFALDERRRAEVFGLLSRRVLLQVTCDPRYYRRNLALVRHVFDAPHVEFIDEVERIQRCARSDHAGFLPTKRAPSCFNIRAVTRQAVLHGDAMPMLTAMRTQHSLTRVCVPSIDPDGTIHVGETDTCAAIGTALDPLDEVQRKVLEVGCEKCGTMTNIPEPVRAWAFPQQEEA